MVFLVLYKNNLGKNINFYVKYNDWDDVVEECGWQARYLSTEKVYRGQ